MSDNFVQNLKLDGFERFTYGKGKIVAAITAGIHGDEQTSVFVAQMLMDFLSTAKLNGSVIVLPLCNPTAFRVRKRESPVDSADLNRSFCKEGSEGFSIRLAREIWDAVKDAPFLLDLHCCGQFGSLYVMSMHGSFPAQRDMARSLGIPNVIHSSEAAGQLFVHANRDNRQALLIEMPGGQPYGIVDRDSAQTVFDAAVRFLAYSGVFSGKTKPPADVLFHGKIKRVSTPHNGLFIPAVTLSVNGEMFNKGDVIGSLNGESWAMPFDGTALAVHRAGYIFEGEHLFTAAPYETQ
jgi:predicted deacylase